MKLDYLKENERLAPRALLGVAALLAILTVAKLWDYHSTSAEAQSIVAKAVDQDKADPNLVKENLAGFKKIADAIKKKNLFVPVPPKRHPVSAVLGIMGEEALIKDKWYKVGDKIGDAKVIAVEATQVKIEWDGKEKYFAPIASGGDSSSPSGRGGREKGGESRGPRPERAETPGTGPERGPGRGGFGDMSEEQRAQMRARMEGMRARFENMSPEEREAFRNEMRGRFGGRGPGGGRGGPGGGPALRMSGDGRGRR